MSNKRPQPRRDFRDSAYAALHRKGVVTAVYLVLRVLVILTLISQFLHGNFENVFFCVLSLVLFLMPTILERQLQIDLPNVLEIVILLLQLQIDLPNVLEIVILLFIFSAWILGEVQTYYTIIPYWDTMLHTLNGFLCAAIGFSLLDILNRNERFTFTLSPVSSTSSWLRGWSRIPAAMFVRQLMPSVCILMWEAAIASGTVDMPTASAPARRAKRTSAAVSNDGPVKSM